MVREIIDGITEAVEEAGQNDDLAERLISWVEDVSNGNDGLEEAANHARVVTDAILLAPDVTKGTDR